MRIINFILALLVMGALSVRAQSPSSEKNEWVNVLLNGFSWMGGRGSISPGSIVTQDVRQSSMVEFREQFSEIIRRQGKKRPKDYHHIHVGLTLHPLLWFNSLDATFERGSSDRSMYMMLQSYSYLNNQSDISEHTVTKSTERLLQYRRNAQYNVTNFMFGGDRQWDADNYTSFSLVLNMHPESSKSTGNSTLSKTDGTQTPYTYSRTYSDRTYGGSLNLYQQHRFANAAIYDFTLKTDVSFNTDRKDQSETGGTKPILYHYHFSKRHFGLSYTPAYHFQWQNVKVKVGLNSLFQGNGITEKHEVDNTFSHREWTEYLYVDGNRSWKRWTAAMTMGVEAIFRKVESVPDHYYTFRPSATLTYRPDSVYTLTGSYRRRASSPGITLLNPYDTSLDPLTVSTGNPHLKPYYTQTFTLSCRRIKSGLYLEPTFRYQQVSDAIVSVGRTLRSVDAVYVQSYINQKTTYQWAVEVNSRYTMKKWGYLGAQLGYNRIGFPAVKQYNQYISGRFYTELHYKNWGFRGLYALPEYSYDHYSRIYASSETLASIISDIRPHLQLALSVRYIGSHKTLEQKVDKAAYRKLTVNRFINRSNLILVGLRYKI